MNRNALRTMIRSVAAMLAMAGLLVGLPVALWVLAGWPLPTRLPTVDQVQEALGGSSISDSILVKGLALVCWMAWAQLAVCILAEGRAWIGGRAPSRVPLAGVFQPLARHLVLSAVLILPALRPSASPAPFVAIAAVEASVHPGAAVAEHPAGDATAASATPVPNSAADAPNCIVRPYDNLWSLAEDHLGDGYRWRELFDLNRDVRQADGRSLQDPDRIHPGWTLVFPADAVGLAAAETTTEQDPVAPPAPAPSEVFAPAEPPIVATEPAPSASVEHLDMAVPAKSEVPSAHSEQSRDSMAEDADDSGTPVPAAVAGLGLMAAGVVVTIDHLRRVQQRRRHTGRTIPIPAGPSAETERLLRTAATGSLAGRLDTALRMLAKQLAARKAGPVPAVEAVSVGAEEIEILLTVAVAAPAGPFEVTAEGRSWTLRSAVPVPEVERPAPLPALVTVGTAEGRQVMVDLEAHGTTVLLGAQGETSALLGAMALELATSGWADDMRLVIVGDAPDGLGQLDRVRTIGSLEEALPEIEAEVEALAKELGAAGHESTFDARLARTADGWVPTVVFVPDPGDPLIGRLIELATQKQGLALVVEGDAGCAVERRITCNSGTVEVNPPGLQLIARQFGVAAFEAACTVLGLAASDAEGDEMKLPDGHDTTRPADDPTVSFLAAVEPPAVEISIFGSPEVSGGANPIDRKKSKELVVYLALHPRGADESSLKTALWPDRVPSPGSFNQTISRARLCLGRNSDGMHHLPHVVEGMYRLGPEVTTDYHRLEKAFSLAKAEGSAAAIDSLAAVLDTVRGMPFEGAGGYEWAHTKGLLAHAEAVAADAALLLTEWFLDRRDTTRALSAAARGLAVSPADERLFRARMRAHDLDGNPAGVQAVMDELCRVVQALEPYDELHPETVALYQELSRRRRRTG